MWFTGTIKGNESQATEAKKVIRNVITDAQNGVTEFSESGILAAILQALEVEWVAEEWREATPEERLRYFAGTNPERYVYRITEDGKLELRHWA